MLEEVHHFETRGYQADGERLDLVFNEYATNMRVSVRPIWLFLVPTKSLRDNILSGMTTEDTAPRTSPAIDPPTPGQNRHTTPQSTQFQFPPQIVSATRNVYVGMFHLLDRRLSFQRYQRMADKDLCYSGLAVLLAIP